MHLRMTGNLLLVPPGDTERRFLRVRIDLDDGRHVLFCDARRFGTGIVLLGHDARARLLRGPRRHRAARARLHGRGAAGDGDAAAGRR